MAQLLSDDPALALKIAFAVVSRLKLSRGPSL